jgi:hypothetical protein
MIKMSTQKRNKYSGALIFNQTKEENQQVKDRKKMKMLEKQIQILQEIIINKLGDIK